ncbi:MAG: ATP-binding cassette domain-containing protein [Pseudomonadota bacterium]
MSDVIVSLKNIGLSYRKKRSFFRHSFHAALKDVSFDIYRGETVGIIGRNGSGKSTLLKVLSGIYKPDTGVIDNRSRKTSLLTLQAGFDDNLSGRDNALLSGMLLGYGKEEILSNMANIEVYSELGKFFHEPMKSYSTGMRARLGFATLAFLTPEVLLLDEILGVGDNKFREKSSKTMADMISSDNTVVLVSHSAPTVLGLCSRVIWIEEGMVRQQGDPKEVVSAYQAA